MGARKPGAWLLNVAVLGGLLMIPCPAQGASAAKEELLQFLVERNEAAWQEIQSLTSIQYRLDREWLDRRSQRPFHATAQVKKTGHCLWCMYRVETHTGPLQVVEEKQVQGLGKMPLYAPDTSVGRTKMAERRVVVNDQYMAEWPAQGNPLAYRWDHNSVDTMSEKMRRHLKMSLPPDFLQSCFGDDRQRFSGAVQTGSSRGRYEAVELLGEDDRALYQIRRFYPVDSQKPDMVWVIDPQKGFLATELVFIAGREVPVFRRKMHVKQVAQRIWYPLGFEEVRFTEPNQPGESPNVETWSTITLTDVRVNEPIPDEQFDIEALRLQKDRPDITVLRTTVDGREISHVYHEGKLVPRD